MAMKRGERRETGLVPFRIVPPYASRGTEVQDGNGNEEGECGAGGGHAAVARAGQGDSAVRSGGGGYAASPECRGAAGDGGAAEPASGGFDHTARPVQEAPLAGLRTD